MTTHMQTAGIHHITAFAGDPQANVDFYAGVLALRMVKKTINFDAPEVYHLYFGNESGAPGTIMTFFPMRGSRHGKIGGGQVGVTSFAVPVGALPFWENRLRKLDIDFETTVRFGETYLQFQDNEGLQLELVERAEGANSTWAVGSVTTDVAIKGFGGSTLYSVRAASTERVLTNIFGMTKVGVDGNIARFRATGDLGQVIDLRTDDISWGAGGTGTIHHIAWRASDDVQHQLWRSIVADQGFHPTQIIDRQYFNAIYFRESGGILFEIATDPPGFARDELPNKLGSKIMLPEWYEPHRSAIEANLLPIEVRVIEGE